MPASISSDVHIALSPFHEGQIAAYRTLQQHRFKVLRCGRRFGKTQFAQTWLAQGLLQGEETAWFSPQHRTWSEVYLELADTLRPILASGSKASAAIRTITGGRLDFWSLESKIAARGRRYRRIVIDEAAFAKDGDNTEAGSLHDLWEKAIKPTLYDYGGQALIASNSAGKNPNNFFYNICTDPKYGFKEYKATTLDNPTLPKRLPGETDRDWLLRREELRAELKRDNDPLVYAQEYLAEFVDWAGVAFFARDRLLVGGEPILLPTRCDCVFAVIDTASKTGTNNDATAVTFFAQDRHGSRHPLMILDWDIVQIEGALLEIWLPQIFERLEELARTVGARMGSIGTFIEDQNSGTILLQQALRRGMPARAIDSKLTSLGKDERAISVSGYVFRGSVKYTELAYNKATIYKQKSRNHLVEQVESFRIGDKDNKREDDLLDTFCYGIALSLGNSEGF